MEIRHHLPYWLVLELFEGSAFYIKSRSHMSFTNKSFRKNKPAENSTKAVSAIINETRCYIKMMKKLI
jgi:hypothetical protein